MDRDPSENILDPVERVSPATGDNDTGDTGAQARRIYDKRAAHRGQDGEDPDLATDRIGEIARPGLHGGGGNPAWRTDRPADRSKE